MSLLLIQVAFERFDSASEIGDFFAKVGFVGGRREVVLADVRSLGLVDHEVTPACRKDEALFLQALYGGLGGHQRHPVLVRQLPTGGEPISWNQTTLFHLSPKVIGDLHRWRPRVVPIHAVHEVQGSRTRSTSTDAL